MRLRLAHARWCIGIIIMIVVNVHISLWVRRVYDKSSSTDFHPLYSDLAQQFSRRNGNYSVMSNAPTVEGGELGYYVFVPAGNFTEPTLTPPVQNTTEESPQVIQVINYTEVRSYVPKFIPESDFRLNRSHLPTFAVDETEFILSSMIERSAQSSNLYLTTFMLCHYALRTAFTRTTLKKVHPIMKETWLRASVNFKKARYHESGARMQEDFEEIFECEISHSSKSTPYVVTGTFMPNRLTSDPNANRLLDILRCPMNDSLSAVNEFAQGNESISVRILKGKISIVAFTIPWLERRTGFLLRNSKASSHIDPWKGHQSSPGDKPFKAVTDKLHICVPCSSQEPARSVLPMYLEFVSHHTLLGASHINIPVPFSWNSPQMNHFTELFQSYIQEGNMNQINSL